MQCFQASAGSLSVLIGNQECRCRCQISKFKRLVWPKFMLPIIFFLTYKVFLAISLLEKSITAKIWETFLCKTLTSPKRAKNDSFSKIDLWAFPKPIVCSENNNKCCSCGLSSFRPTEVILTPSRKIRNTQLRFVFLNFSFMCQGLKLDRPRCTIGYCYNGWKKMAT